MYPSQVQQLSLQQWVRSVLRPDWWPPLHSSIFPTHSTILAVALQDISQEPAEFAKCGTDLFSMWMHLVTLDSTFDLFCLPFQSYIVTGMLVREVSWPSYKSFILTWYKTEPYSGCLQKNEKIEYHCIKILLKPSAEV